jgi:ribonucleoside-diphosphate reductase alpha chain
MSYVTKRDGRKESIQFDKITERINRLINPIELHNLNLTYLNLQNEINILDPILVAQKVVASVFSGITTEELDIESAEICVNLSTTHPSYSYLGGRILISNLHKKTLSIFTDKMNLLSNINNEWLLWVNAHSNELNSMIDYNRDYLYDYFGFKTLEKSYLLKNDILIIERPQDMLLRCAITLQMGNLELIKKTYDNMSLGYYTHASPTLFNSGTNHMQLASCYLLGTNDDLTSITTTWNSCAQISKWAGGIGLHVSNIRGKNSLIKGTNGRSNGLVPFLRVFNDISRWIDQGGRRPGSIAIYLEPHHPDIFEFLNLRKNFGSETERARDLFMSIWMCDLFMKQVEIDGDWYLLSSDICPGLNDVYGAEYESLYWKYVNENKYATKIPARKLWMTIMETQIETGMPYICYKDNINNKNNQKNIGPIRSSNLCVHEDTQILTNNGYYPISELKDTQTVIWNGSEWSNVTVKKTGTNTDLIRINLSNGAFLDCTPEHKFYIYSDVKSKIQVEVSANELQLGNILIKCDLPGAFEFEYIQKYDDLSIIPMHASINDRLRWFENYCNINASINYNNELEITCFHPIASAQHGESLCEDTSVNNNKNYLLNIRLMLHTLGIESKITGFQPGAMSIFNNNILYKTLYKFGLSPHGYASNENTNYKLVIKPTDLYSLSNLGFKTNCMVYKEIEDNITESYISIVSIELSYKNVDTYCFTEPLQHKGIFNGILTGQCAEIVQYSDHNEYAVCNLASIALKPFVTPFINKIENTWVVYTKPNCKYCNYVKKYLSSLEIQYTEIINNKNIIYPQIFINDILIGGWKDLYKYTAGTFDYDKLYEIAYLATINLNKIIDINYYPVPQTKLSNMKHRPIGLGIQGLADALVLMRIPFETQDALDFNSKIMETIYLASMTASNDISIDRYTKILKLVTFLIEKQIIYPEFYDSSYIVYNFNGFSTQAPTWLTSVQGCTSNNIINNQTLASIIISNNFNLMDYINENKYNYQNKIINEEMNNLYHELKPNKYELERDITKTTLGSYSSFDGSPFSEGKFQFDLCFYDKLYYKEKWDLLRKSIIKYGTRNSLLTALMPTASTSQILSNNECFEFFTNNIYTRKTTAGDFVLVNKYLVNDLINIGLWSSDIKNKIIAMNGSIQSLEEIPLEYKLIYKTIWEIKQLWVLKAAVARSPFVDQSQSMNIFMAEPDYQRLSSSHFWGWKNGLKTGVYYLRTKPSTDAIKFTIDPTLSKSLNSSISVLDNSSCENCSA